MNKRIICAFALLLLTFGGVSGAAEQPFPPKFVPLEPILPLSQVMPNMKAQVKTVIEGTKITTFDATLLGVVPRKTRPNNLIVIRIDDKLVRANGGIAAGMSGSPVYVGGRLAGAIGYGFPFSDVSLGLVTPIEEMIKAAEWPERIPALIAAPVIVDSAEPSPDVKPAAKAAASADAAAVETTSSDVKPDAEIDVVDEQYAPGDDIFVEPERQEEEKEELKPEEIDEILNSWKKEAKEDDAQVDEAGQDGNSSSLGLPPELAHCAAQLSEMELMPLAMPLQVDGISARMTERLQSRLGMELIPLGGSSQGGGVNLAAKPEPGAAIGAALAWGDFQVGGIGTLTALDKEGRFIAFGHPMNNKGAVTYAATEAEIIKIIPSINSSFKLGYQGAIIGIVTQDRPEAVSGRLARLAPANSYTVRFHDVDTGKKAVKRFQTVADPFMGPELGATGMIGVIEDLWGRIGEGTAILRYTFSGGGLLPGWQRSNFYFSDSDIVISMTKEFDNLAKIFALNHFKEISPYGVDLEIEITRDPRVVYIEKLKIVQENESYKPGDEVLLDVTLHPWRKEATVKRLSLKVPENAIGFCEIVVRGGGIAEMGQESLFAGYRAITSLEELIEELNAEESNNQLILEIKSDGDLFFPRSGKSKDGKDNKDGKDSKTGDGGIGGSGREDSLPSIDDLTDDRSKSEIIAERLEEQTMKIIDTNYFVEGLLRKTITIDGRRGGKK